MLCAQGTVRVIQGGRDALWFGHSCHSRSGPYSQRDINGVDIYSTDIIAAHLSFHSRNNPFMNTFPGFRMFLCRQWLVICSRVLSLLVLLLTDFKSLIVMLLTFQHALVHWHHHLTTPRYNKADPYYLLTRREQVTVFRLRTDHNRLSYHLYSKLCIGHTEQCPCGTGSQTTEHLLQSCPIYEPLRKGIWPDHTPVARKLYGRLRDLRCTATFIEETGVSV